jgi:hypothetical protein
MNWASITGRCGWGLLHLIDETGPRLVIIKGRNIYCFRFLHGRKQQLAVSKIPYNHPYCKGMEVLDVINVYFMKS